MLLLLLASCGQLSFLALWFEGSYSNFSLLNMNYYFLNTLTLIELVVLAWNTHGFNRVFFKLRGYMFRLSQAG